MVPSDGCWCLRLVRVYGFGVQRRIFSSKIIVRAVLVALGTKHTNEEDETPGLPEGSTPSATPITSPGYSVERNPAVYQEREPRSAMVDAVQPRWAGLPVSDPRTLRSRGELKNERAPNPLFFHRVLGISVDSCPKTLLHKNTCCFVESDTFLPGQVIRASCSWSCWNWRCWFLAYWR